MNPPFNGSSLGSSLGDSSSLGSSSLGGSSSAAIDCNSPLFNDI